MRGRLYIGTSGYSYLHWKGCFYPEDLPSSRWLSYYAQFFNAVELNVTFYRRPRKSTYEKWYRETPENFSFVLKAPRTITHFSRLEVTDQQIKEFFEDISTLKEKAACVLWQLPPQMKFDGALLKNFLNKLKKLTPENLRHAFEFRNQAFYSKPCYEILKNYNVAFVCAHSARYPCKFVDTADFSYFRFHGPGSLYNSSYSDEQLNDWAQIIKKVLEKKPVFVFFNNDFSGFAVNNALYLKDRLGGL